MNKTFTEWFLAVELTNRNNQPFFCSLLCVSRHVRKCLSSLLLYQLLCIAVCCFGAGHDDSVLQPWQITDRPFNGSNWPTVKRKVAYI